MIDDVIKLVSVRYVKDRFGNQKPVRTPRQVFCKVGNVGRSEFYQAAQAGLKPEYIFTLSHYIDYEGEPELLYTDRDGKEKLYSIVRVYRPANSDRLEITAELKVGINADSDKPDGSDSE